MSGELLSTARNVQIQGNELKVINNGADIFSRETKNRSSQGNFSGNCVEYFVSFTKWFIFQYLMVPTFSTPLCQPFSNRAKTAKNARNDSETADDIKTPEARLHTMPKKNSTTKQQQQKFIYCSN